MDLGPISTLKVFELALMGRMQRIKMMNILFMSLLCSISSPLAVVKKYPIE
jgi:hypothetical protein